jgi:hypothetical protein
MREDFLGVECDETPPKRAWLAISFWRSTGHDDGYASTTPDDGKASSLTLHELPGPPGFASCYKCSD